MRSRGVRKYTYNYIDMLCLILAINRDTLLDKSTRFICSVIRFINNLRNFFCEASMNTPSKISQLLTGPVYKKYKLLYRS